MAYADYLHCVVCDCKTLYDAECNYDAATGRLHDIATICKECSKTHSLTVINKPSDPTQRFAEFLQETW